MKSSCFLFTTTKCNLSCKHCYVEANPYSGEHMSDTVFHAALDFIKKAKIKEVRLTGGEPTIHPKFPQHLLKLSVEGIKPRLITNGVKLIKQINPETTLQKLSGCWISLYGLSETEHKQVGGMAAPELRSVLDFVAQYASSGFNIGVSVSIHQTEIDRALEFLQLAESRGVSRLRMLFTEPSGRAVETGLWRPMITACDKNPRERWETFVSNAKQRFEFFTLSNPHNILGVSSDVHGSCLLKERGMWSIEPSGNIYSCCYNVGKEEHNVGSVFKSENFEAILGQDVFVKYATRCDALKANYWRTSGEKGLCPLSVAE
jgi:MoaA/NifB/PqqE/SkfB family radical SAM enzyme